VLRFPRSRTDADRQRALSAVKASPFEIGANLELLHEKYRDLWERQTI
jgi:hypothetical protein